MLKEDAKKLMQYAIDKANSLGGTSNINELTAWCDHIDCLVESLRTEFEIDLGVYIDDDNEYQMGE